ncbi:MAG: hypothetical protein JST63_06045 [Bacteroidetes bacterium]|nr:hypothetical protein [Bacteroidota bacterium]
MHLNLKALLFTLGLYVLYFLAVYFTEKLYTPKAANDITGPPFMVGVAGLLILLIFFFRSIYVAFAVDKSYWGVVILHVILLLIIMYKFTV